MQGDCADGGSAQPWAGPGYKCSAVPCPHVTVRATTLRSTAITVLSVTCPGPSHCVVSVHSSHLAISKLGVSRSFSGSQKASLFS